MDEEEEAVPNSSKNTDEDWSPDFHWLTPQVAVGACFPMERALNVAQVHGVTAVIDLRKEDRDDDEALRTAGIELLHLPTPDLEPASIDMLDLGVEWTRARIERGGKILIHCQHGIGRSTLLALCVLVDQGWQPLDALAHAKDQRGAMSPSRSQYDGWVAWLTAHGKAAPDYHTFGCIAYRHLAHG
jgi:protein-tyrosine phosphatase